MNRLTNLTVSPKGFIFDPSSGEMFTVNATGLGILRGLQEQKTPAIIAGELSRKFPVTPEQVEKDIFDFKSQLRAFHLL